MQVKRAEGSYANRRQRFESGMAFEEINRLLDALIRTGGGKLSLYEVVGRRTDGTNELRPSHFNAAVNLFFHDISSLKSSGDWQLHARRSHL